MKQSVRKEWLTRRTTIEAATKRYPALADERFRALWRNLKDGDELWYFKTPAVTWRKRAGRMGVAVCCRGVIVAQASVGKMN
jgi:hypothetical protein